MATMFRKVFMFYKVLGDYTRCRTQNLFTGEGRRQTWEQVGLPPPSAGSATIRLTLGKDF
jgi:hypothetical protein